MCIVLLAHLAHPEYPLVLIANRDERYDRPTRRMSWWDESPPILAGKDLEAGGTWLGVDQSARLALLTNFRGPGLGGGERSRGELPLQFLRTPGEDETGFESSLLSTQADYSGYNLLYGRVGRLSHFSNRDQGFHRLQPGYHGLSNATLDTPWPKVERGKELLRAALARPGAFPDSLFEVLKDDSKPSDESLPNTGIETSVERALSSIFIATPSYGSRSGAVIVAASSGTLRVWERDYSSGEERFFEWNPQAAG